MPGNNGLWRDAATRAMVSIAVLACGTRAFGAPAPLPITEFPVPTSNCSCVGITWGPDGNLWFTESSSNKIGRMTPAGSITEFVVPTGSAIPYGITAGPDGNVWFTEQLGNKIGRITPIGSITEFTIPSAGPPMGITAGLDGNLWFTEEGAGKIGRITPVGVITEFATPTAASGPSQIASGPDGTLWFTEKTANKIGRLVSASTTPQIAEFAVPTTNSGLEGVTVGPDGNVWFAEFNKGQIGRMTPVGAITEFATSAPYSSPARITAGPDGNVWFTEFGLYKIARITSVGAITEFPIPSATSLPWGITVGPGGALWFVEDFANKIGRLTLPPGGVLQYTDGSLGLWYLGGVQGNQVWKYVGLSGPLVGWAPVDLVDLNGDRFPDVILRQTDGSLGVWLLGGAAGSQFLGAATLSGPLPGWTPVGAADLNNDGHPDLILQYTDGEIAVTYLGGAQGTQPLSFVVISAPLGGWRVVGAADLDGDGHPDLVMQYPDGELAVTYLGGTQGAQPLSFVVISGPVAGWGVVGVTDVNGDGHPDLISRYTDGSLGVTYLGGAQGRQPQAFALMSGPLPNWQEAFPH